ncbi:MAG: CHAD domain-containing protein [Thermoleophilaceae bacterium]
MKARKVKGLDPDGALAENALRIARTRLDELHSFAGAARDPENVTALHDMRIAAKRVRYLLELVEPCFGQPAKRGAKRAKALQTLLGEIHDCDEMLPLVRGHVKRLRAEDATAIRAGAGERATDLDPDAARAAPNRTRYRGLEALHAYLRARRHVLYVRFVREWAKLEGDGFREALEGDLARAAGATLQSGSEEGVHAS